MVWGARIRMQHNEEDPLKVRGVEFVLSSERFVCTRS